MVIKSKEWLIKHRKDLGLTQSDFAKRCNLTISTIQNIEQGKRLGSPDTWAKIEEALNSINDPLPIYNINFSDMIGKLYKQIDLYGGEYSVYLFYEINIDFILFTNYLLPEEFELQSNTVSSNKKYMKASLATALEIFEFQNKIRR